MTVAIVPAIQYVGSNGHARYGFKVATNKAILLEVQDEQYTWLPLSKIFFLNTSAGLAVVMPVWLARQNGFSYTVSSDEEINNQVHAGKADYLSLFDNGALVVENFLKLR